MSTVYDEDIVLWSEQQADAIRRLGQFRRDLPNELDLDNIAEEIESVGRSETASVVSFVRLLMLHLIKIASAPDAPAVPHWREEALSFGADASLRFAPSMVQRIDLDQVWLVARDQAKEGLTLYGNAIKRLPEHCPWSIDELVRNRPDLDKLLSRLEPDEDLSVP